MTRYIGTPAPGSTSQLFRVIGYRDVMIGQVLASRFQLVERIGEGGMAVVYKARQKSVDRLVAVKLLKQCFLSDDAQVKRFVREARALSRLDHPNLPKVYDIGQTPAGQPYFIMELLEGSSIGQMVAQRGPLPESLALKVFLQVVDAVAHAHSISIIHRDLKPENIMLVSCDDDQYTVKVVDFGIVKYADDQVVSQRLTRTGEVWGSPTYMSPEQCEGSEVDGRTDIYSLGLVFYEAITGVQPIDGKTIAEIIHKQLSETPPRFSEVNPQIEVSTRLEEVVFRMMEKDKQKRFQSMEQVKHALQSLSGNLLDGSAALRLTEPTRFDVMRKASTEGDNSQRIVTTPPAESRAPQVLLVLLLLLLLAPALCLGGYWLWQSSRNDQPSGKQEASSRPLVPDSALSSEPDSARTEESMRIQPSDPVQDQSGWADAEAPSSGATGNGGAGRQISRKESKQEPATPQDTRSRTGARQRSDPAPAFNDEEIFLPKRRHSDLDYMEKFRQHR